MLYKPAASVQAQYKLIHMCQKKSKNVSFPQYSKFQFLYRHSREARDLDQAQTSAMNSQICLFWLMKINAPKWVIYCHFPATRCKLCYITKSEQFLYFNFSNVSYWFEMIKAIKHKISKVLTVTCVDVFVQIEQSSCAIAHKNGLYVLQKCLLLAPRYMLTC